MYNTDSPLIKEIKTLIQAEANNNPAPEKATITKIYNDGNVDAETNNGIISYADCIGTPTIKQTGLVCYADGDLNNPVFITKTTLSGVKWTDITEKPSTYPSTWDNISSKPTSYPSTWENISSKPTSYPSTWNDISNKPTSYPTTWDDITDKPTDYPTPETWEATNTNYVTSYIDTRTGNTNYLKYTRLGQIATVNYYFTLKNAVTSTGYNNVVTTIPYEFNPSVSVTQIIANTSGVHFGMYLTESYIRLRHYSTGTQGGTIAGTLSFKCKGDAE